MPPSPADVVLGIVAVVVACLAGIFAVQAAWHDRRLWLVCAAGCAAAAAGVVGQRTFPSEDLVTRLGRDAAARQVPGPWDAGVGIPVLGLHLTPLTLVGILMAIAGLSLVLFLEPAAVSGTLGRSAPLEEDDQV
jgi:disulfide bond formation protein DsbB